MVIFTVAAGGVFGAYTLEDPVALNISLGAAIFGVSAVLPVLNAWSTELFPTELRANGYAWSNNLLGRIGYVIGPVAVGWGAESFGWGPAVAATAFGPLAALGLILLWMPETRGKELEETSLLR
jgi:putative MFS transporter